MQGLLLKYVNVKKIARFFLFCAEKTVPLHKILKNVQ